MENLGTFIKVQSNPNPSFLISIAPLYFSKPEEIIFLKREYNFLPKKEPLELEELKSLKVIDINRFNKRCLEDMCIHWLH